MERINYMQPSYDENEIEAVNEYLKSGGWLTEYKKTREFEQAIKNATNAQYCSVMANGTVTLISALLACNIQIGDEVIVPDFTMSATSHAAALIGAKPVFVDIEPDTLCMDYNQMCKAVTSKTKAVIVVDLNGRAPSKLMDIVRYCKEKGIWLIEDAAQALGSTYHGKPLGTFGDIGSFSFSMPKIITTGQGGAVVTNNALLYEKMLKIRDFGREKTGSDHYVMIGGNFKFTDIQAVIGIEQMKKLSDRVQKKKEIAKMYESGLANIPEIKLIHNNYNETAPCFIEILCKSKIEKEELAEHLESNNIGTRFFYPPLHAEPAYGDTESSFPVTEEISPKGLWLPSFVELTQEMIHNICQYIKEFYKE